MPREIRSRCLDRNEANGGTEIELRDNIVFSSEITQPILSYGRLMDAGWSICAKNKCLKNGIYEVPLEFQNHSLVVKGHVRKVCAPVQEIRGVKAILTPRLQNYAEHGFGWNKEGNRWIGFYLSAQYQDPLFNRCDQERQAMDHGGVL